MVQVAAPDVIGVTMGLFFFTAGAWKLYGWEWAKAQYLRRNPLWVYYASAYIEVVTGIGLPLRSTRFAAALLQLGLNVAMTIRGEGNMETKVAVPAFMTSSLLLWLAYVSRP